MPQQATGRKMVAGNRGSESNIFFDAAELPSEQRAPVQNAPAWNPADYIVTKAANPNTGGSNKGLWSTEAAPGAPVGERFSRGKRCGDFTAASAHQAYVANKKAAERIKQRTQGGSSAGACIFGSATN